jgi:hypothetical protein
VLCFSPLPFGANLELILPFICTMQETPAYGDPCEEIDLDIRKIVALKFDLWIT